MPKNDTKEQRAYSRNDEHIDKQGTTRRARIVLKSLNTTHFITRTSAYDNDGMMNEPDDLIDIYCTDCNSTVGNMKKSWEDNGMFYTGICTNQTCVRKYFVCRPCYEYTNNSGKATGRVGGGKRSGIYATYKSFRKHYKYNLHQLATASDQDRLDDGIDIDNDSISIDIESNIPINSVTAPNDTAAKDIDYFKDCGFDPDSASPKYFMYEEHNPGKGAQYLIAYAFGINTNDVTIEEVEFSLTMAKLLSQLSQTQQSLLATILFYSSNSKDKELSIFKNTRVPTTVDDFQCIYTKGKNAIIPNLPHPVPKLTMDGNHAYVSFGFPAH
jgi:hypothetical protein